MKKKLVIIGANDFQNQLILKAKEKRIRNICICVERWCGRRKNSGSFLSNQYCGKRTDIRGMQEN